MDLNLSSRAAGVYYSFTNGITILGHIGEQYLLWHISYVNSYILSHDYTINMRFSIKKNLLTFVLGLCGF